MCVTVLSCKLVKNLELNDFIKFLKASQSALLYRWVLRGFDLLNFGLELTDKLVKRSSKQHWMDISYGKVIFGKGICFCFCVDPGCLKV